MSKLFLTPNSNTITEIYENYSPAFNNLYTVEIFALSNYDDSIASYLRYHSPSVNFNGESLSLKRNEVTKKFSFEENGSYKRSDNLTITWRECDSWRVKKYHEEWLSKFYDRDKDCYRSYDDKASAEVALYRILRVTFPKVINEKCTIKFRILPNNSGNVPLAWGTSPTIISHSMTYYVEDWEWENAVEAGESIRGEVIGAALL